MAFTDADIAEAHRAAKAASSAEAFYKLGLIYSAGQGAPIDLVEAHKWFNLAAMKGHDSAKIYRRECADMMSKNEIASAQRAAREWLNVSTDQGPASPPTPVVKPAPTPAKPAQKLKPTERVHRYNRLKRYNPSAPTFAA